MKLMTLFEAVDSFIIDGRTVKIGDWIEVDGYPLQIIKYRGRFHGDDAFILNDAKLPDANGVIFADRQNRAPFEYQKAWYVDDLNDAKIIDDIKMYSKSKNYQW